MPCGGVALTLPYPIQCYYLKYTFYRYIQDVKYFLIHLAANFIHSWLVMAQIMASNKLPIEMQP
jgi:hypothetical protein